MQDKNVILLLWALPIAFGLHVFEEFIFPGGLPQLFRDYKPRKPPEKARSGLYYFILNGTALVAALILALMPSVTSLHIYVGFVAVMAANAVSHIRGTVQKRQYCPGTVSGVALLFPLFIVSYWYLLYADKYDWLSAVVNVCIGIFLGFYVLGVDIRKRDHAV